jgi:L-seryl-tRNA(Ser) seleniumtransferase
VDQHVQLRELPSVDAVLARATGPLARYPRALVVEEIRRVLDGMRRAILAGREPVGGAVEAIVERSLQALEIPSLRRVINATGVVLHTNLGRAPLAALTLAGGYSNLEYDIETGHRGKRGAHIAPLLERLLGAPGIAVNNNAAAVYLALHELASGGEVIVSRGELIEIGDGFRIPEIMARSGAILREVGTTNRTHIGDYRAAINERTRLLMRVHPSNFRMEGFTARPTLAELVALSRASGIPLYEDLGSGCLVDLKPYGVEEPLAAVSLSAGVDLISFSGDKLMGGPQAGILAGRADLVERLNRNPMFRALRLDKLIYEVLEASLRALLLGRIEELPALAMIAQPAVRIRERAERLAPFIEALKTIYAVELIDGESLVGGGATPEQPLATCLIRIRTDDANALERKLRLGEPAVIARIEEDTVVLDLRTVLPSEERELLQALSR